METVNNYLVNTEEFMDGDAAFPVRMLCDISEPKTETGEYDCLFQNRWLNKGNCGMIVSASGIGKSSFIMQAAVQWAAGMPMCGICPTRPIKTLVIQAEDDDYDLCLFRNGIRAGLLRDGDWNMDMITEAEKNVAIATTYGLTDDNFFLYMKSLIQNCAPDLVVINPLHAFFGGNINESSACSHFLRQGLDRIIKAKETRCAALIVHHTGKPKENSGITASSYMGNGSAELSNYPRACLSITPYKMKSKNGGVFIVEATKHGDRLGWRDSNDQLTIQKIICYANRLPKYADVDQLVYWVEPTREDLNYLKGTGDNCVCKNNSISSMKKSNDKGLQGNVLTLVKFIKSKPSGTINNASLRGHATKLWNTTVNRNAVKQFEKDRKHHNIEKDSKGCYIYG